MIRGRLGRCSRNALGRRGMSAPAVGDSAWYPNRSIYSANVAARGAAFNVSSVPFTAGAGAFVEAARPVTTLSATVDNDTDYATQCAIDGTHVTVETGTTIGGFVACVGDNTRVTFESACVVGVHFTGPSNATGDRLWFEGATTGTKTRFAPGGGLGNLLTQFQGNAINVAFTDIDFVGDPTDGPNNTISTDRWVYLRCRFWSYGPNSLNVIGDSISTAYYNCTFFTDSGAVQGRWNIRRSGNGDSRTVVLDCAMSTNGSPYASFRCSGIGWWIDGCHIDGGVELTLEVGHSISYAWVTNNVIYRTTSFAGNGTLDRVTITGNTMHSSAGAQSDAQQITNISASAVSFTNYTISGQTYAATNHTFLANGTWPIIPGSPVAIGP
jgi:hypothetical protein